MREAYANAERLVQERTRTLATVRADLERELARSPFDGADAVRAAFLDAALGLALVGDDLLQPRLFLRELLAQAAQAVVEHAEFQRLPLRILDPALVLQGGVLLGLPRLPRQVLQVHEEALRRKALNDGMAYDHELAVQSVYEHAEPLSRLLPDTWFPRT